MSDRIIEMIRRKYETVLGQISKIRGSVEAARLIVVTKSQPVEIVWAAMQAGINCFGENYVEAAIEKIVSLPQSGVEWHMIGHIQSRKADLVPNNFSMVHSLDSAKLANRLEKACAVKKIILPVLIEVNVSGEASKYGYPAWEKDRWDNLLPEIEVISQLPHLRICGLMTMPPYFQEGQQSRPYFQKTRILRDYLAQRMPEIDWSQLSMGTSVDYPIALEEGATFIRVGQAIFGERTNKGK